ncbi:hypothetical protein C8R45DRAFT_1105632 [Mycena sanguinolenta]|nr:hypothetical protein C8R45DRAFT_1105632 [Mycena sanguinolenta]
MSTTHNTSSPSSTFATRDGPSRNPSSGTLTPSSPATTPNFTTSALNFVNVTEEEARRGLTTLRTCKNNSPDSSPEQRAAHNAVERQRRGKLTKRIFELESLLHPANSDRRSTRTTIVNSAIAHLDAARRHSALAAQELRMLQDEADALRREANEWRAHAGIACLDAPVRSEEFQAVLRDELNLPADDVPDGEENDTEVHGSHSSVDGVQRHGLGYPGEYGDDQEREAHNRAAQMEDSFRNPMLDHPETPLAYYYPSLQTIAPDSTGARFFENQDVPQARGTSPWESTHRSW